MNQVIEDKRQAVSFGLIEAARQWKKGCERCVHRYSLPVFCSTPLLIISRPGEAVHQVTLAQLAGIENSSLVRHLDRLCAAGLVRRETDPVDARAHPVSATDESRALAASVEAQLDALRGRVFGHIDEADLDAALRANSGCFAR